MKTITTWEDFKSFAKTQNIKELKDFMKKNDNMLKLKHIDGNFFVRWLNGILIWDFYPKSQNDEDFARGHVEYFRGEDGV